MGALCNTKNIKMYGKKNLKQWLDFNEWEKLTFYHLKIRGYTQLTDISMRKRKKH